MDVRFVIRSPSGKRRNGVVPLPVLVGRGEEAKIRIPQDSVSRRHCEFVERDGHVWIRDLGSTNGTLLDGKRVQPNVDTPVSSGGTVSVGDVQIRVEYAMPRAGDDDRTILLKRLPDVDRAGAADAEHPGLIELGAAADETQSDAGPPLEMEATETEPIETPAAGVEPPVATTAGPADNDIEAADPGGEDFAFLSAADTAASAEPAGDVTAGNGQEEVEATEPSTEDFAFLSAADPAAPPATTAQPVPPAKPAESPAAAKPTAKPAAKPAVAKPPAQPSATSASGVPSEPLAQADGDDFTFLAADPAPPAEQLPAWPTGAEEPAPVDEDDLNDFFKSLS